MINQYDKKFNKQGPWEHYYTNGQISDKGNYVDDLKDGYWVGYVPNGRLSCKGNYIKGRKHGPWEYHWHTNNDTVSVIKTFQNGKQTGLQINYSSDGTRVSTKFFAK